MKTEITNASKVFIRKLQNKSFFSELGVDGMALLNLN
jgi:hypothetical protein